MRLKELRLEHGLTQKQVAEMIGVSLSTYKRYERGICAKMKIDKVAILMQYYGVKFEELMGDIRRIALGG